MTGMDDLVTWLRVQLDDDERVARAADPQRLLSWVENATDESDADEEHVTRWDPARVLAEVDAKRRILDLHAPDTTRYAKPQCHECSGCGCCSVDWPCDTLQLLALSYAGLDGYREEWRPSEPA